MYNMLSKRKMTDLHNQYGHKCVQQDFIYITYKIFNCVFQLYTQLKILYLRIYINEN